MPSPAILLQRVRYGLARWLMPDIRELLVKRVADEKEDTEQPQATEEVNVSADMPATFAAMRLGPPEHWLARVREGAPQLLAGEDEGGVPRLQLNEGNTGERAVVDTTEPVHSVPAQWKESRNQEHLARIPRNRESEQDRAPSEAPVEAQERISKVTTRTPGKSSQAPPASQEPDGHCAKAPTARAKIANAIRAVARALSDKKSPSGVEAIHSVAGSKRAKVAPEQAVQRTTSRQAQPIAEGQPLAIGPSRRDSKLEGASRQPPTPRATTEIHNGDVYRREREGSSRSLVDLRRILQPPAVDTEGPRNAMVRPMRDRRETPDQLDEPGVVASVPAQVPPRATRPARPATEYRESQPASLQESADLSVANPARRILRSPQPPGNVSLPVNHLKARPPASYPSAAVRHSTADKRFVERRGRPFPPNHWPVLMKPSRQEGSFSESLLIQQRQAFLKREQTGGD